VDIFTRNVFRLHGLPDSIVSDRGPQFISKFWKTIHKELGVSVDLTTAYHPQSDGQTERVNQVLEQYLRCFMNYHQDNWYELLPLAEFAYNNSLHKSINCSPFYANYGFNPRADELPVILESRLSAQSLPQHIAHNFAILKTALQEAQCKYKKFADERRKDITLDIGTQVWLNAKNIKTTRPSAKFDYRRLGPFTVVERIGEVAYRLELPVSFGIHDVFHVSLLEPVTPTTVVNRLPGPAPVEINQEAEHEVEEVLDSRIRRNHGQYLVFWKGYSLPEATWEPYEHLQNCRDLIKEFHSKFPDKPGPFTALGARR
jgi:hypothetical protein